MANEMRRYRYVMCTLRVVTCGNHLQARFQTKRTRFERAANRKVRRRLDALSSTRDQTHGSVDITHDGPTS